MVKIYTDAAFNPKNQSAAIVVTFQIEHQAYQYSSFIPEISDNHEAEFAAMVLCLTTLCEQELNQKLCQIFSDSKIVIQSIEKQYVKDKRYQPYLQEILALIEQFELIFFNWIPEKQNLAADQLAKSILRKNQLH